jgi:hypothetical protein
MSAGWKKTFAQKRKGMKRTEDLWGQMTSLANLPSAGLFPQFLASHLTSLWDATLPHFDRNPNSG